MPVFSLTRQELRALTPTTFAEAGFNERGDLQRLLREQIEVIAPGTLVIAEEFGEWEDSRRRIDLLGVDQEANIVVVELKRTDDGGHMELQALRYAAMVSTMTFDRAVEAFSRYLASRGDERDARELLSRHIGGDLRQQIAFPFNVRIVLAAADFSRELTTTVLWLNAKGLDIRCVRMRPYADDARLVVDIQPVIPLPEVEEYQIRIREKEQRERVANQEISERQVAMTAFWAQLVDTARSRTNLFEALTPKPQVRIFKPAGAAVGGLRFDYFVGINQMRVGLEINRPALVSKAIFDQLFKVKADIEHSFGGPLDWQRLDAQNRSRIDDFPIPCQGVAVEEAWPEMIEQLLDAMIRFEAALRPHLDRLTLPSGEEGSA